MHMQGGCACVCVYVQWKTPFLCPLFVWFLVFLCVFCPRRSKTSQTKCKSWASSVKSVKKKPPKKTHKHKKIPPCYCTGPLFVYGWGFPETQQRVHFAIVHPDVRNIHIKWTWVCVQTAATDTQHEYKLYFFFNIIFSGLLYFSRTLSESKNRQKQTEEWIRVTDIIMREICCALDSFCLRFFLPKGMKGFFFHKKWKGRWRCMTAAISTFEPVVLLGAEQLARKEKTFNHSDLILVWTSAALGCGSAVVQRELRVRRGAVRQQHTSQARKGYGLPDWLIVNAGLLHRMLHCDLLWVHRLWVFCPFLSPCSITPPTTRPPQPPAPSRSRGFSQTPASLQSEVRLLHWNCCTKYGTSKCCEISEQPQCCKKYLNLNDERCSDEDWNISH